LRQIEAYKGVFQATAEVEGLLHKGMDRIDLLRACFPGGSVTGCPKIRSMEIIEELEPEARSIYTGALGFLSFHNTMEFNVLIRSFLKKKDEVSFHAGGGIVTDSEPEAEYEETLIKAKALFEALTGEKKDGSGLAR
jgi:para-aminobenzoate synthetase component 1